MSMYYLLPHVNSIKSEIKLCYSYIPRAYHSPDSFEVDANITYLLIRLRKVKGCVQFVSGEATRT